MLGSRQGIKHGQSRKLRMSERIIYPVGETLLATPDNAPAQARDCEVTDSED